MKSSILADRLKAARSAAGYATATDAAMAHGWPAPTYLSHENGSRGVTRDRVATYAKAYRVAPEWLLFGKGPGPDSSEPEPPGTFAEESAAWLAEPLRLNVVNFRVVNGQAEMAVRFDAAGIDRVRATLDLLEKALKP